jgi:hypothetical protein
MAGLEYKTLGGSQGEQNQKNLENLDDQGSAHQKFVSAAASAHVDGSEVSDDDKNSQTPKKDKKDKGKGKEVVGSVSTKGVRATIKRPARKEEDQVGMKLILPKDVLDAEQRHDAYVAGTSFQFGREELGEKDTRSLVPTYGMPDQSELTQLVDQTGVSMLSKVIWKSNGSDSFYHEEVVGEKALYNYPMRIEMVQHGGYGQRTPILHPAVAAIDATQAGIDDAFLRALQNIDQLVGGGKREDSGPSIRMLATKYSKLQYNPVRLLVRAAALYIGCTLAELTEKNLIDYRSIGVGAAPRHVTNTSTYSSMCASQLNDARDILYIDCAHEDESYMIEVLQALASKTYPVHVNASIRQLWPALKSPAVMYTGPHDHRLMRGAFSADDVVESMKRFCTIFDCHDIWEHAMGLAMLFVARAADSGVLGGADEVMLALPMSDLRVGAIGPLLAGVSAEGMRSSPVTVPSGRELLYAAGAMGVFFNAAYYEGLQTFSDTNPVVVRATKKMSRHYNMLATVQSAKAFMHKVVGPIIKAAGWDFASPLTEGVYLQGGKNFAKRLFRPERVCWWTSVVTHMGDMRKSFLQHWAHPAAPTGTITPGKWQPFHFVGAVTHVQVGTAVRWMGAQLKYVRVRIPDGLEMYNCTSSNHNRFTANMSPKLQSSQGPLLGAMLLGQDAFKKQQFVASLGRADVFAFRLYDKAIPYNMEELPPMMGDGDELVQPTEDDEDEEEFYPSHPRMTGLMDMAGLPRPQLTDPSPPPSPKLGQREVELHDDVDWNEVNDGLKAFGLDVEPDVYRQAIHLDGGTLSGFVRMSAAQVADFDLSSIENKADTTAAIKAYEDYLLALNRMTPHLGEDRRNRRAAEQRKMAVTALDRIKAQAGTVERWPEAVEGDAVALKSGASKALDKHELPIPARDDAVGPTETVQDFGQTTSGPSYTVQGHDAKSALQDILAGPSIGFETPNA